MAEDVLRLAGFTEHVNYRKQTQVGGGSGRPDYTFDLPKGHVLYMDVKFPLASYLRYLEVGTDAERQAHLKRFLTDVRGRVKELARREYAREGDRPTVDYVLLFLPNEQLTGFIHEHDPALLDDAMAQRVVLCSPLTLFAFLGVIRQAFDNFMIEQTSDEILQLIGKFGQQWGKYTESIEKVKNRLDGVQKELDLLVGTRRRALERPLQQLEDLRVQRNLPVDGELFPERRRPRQRPRARCLVRRPRRSLASLARPLGRVTRTAASAAETCWSDRHSRIRPDRRGDRERPPIRAIAPPDGVRGRSAGTMSRP